MSGGLAAILMGVSKLCKICSVVEHKLPRSNAHPLFPSTEMGIFNFRTLAPNSSSGRLNSLGYCIRLRCVHSVGKMQQHRLLPDSTMQSADISCGGPQHGGTVELKIHRQFRTITDKGCPLHAVNSLRAQKATAAKMRGAQRKPGNGAVVYVL